jgi:hypothetical protein
MHLFRDPACQQQDLVPFAIWLNFAFMIHDGSYNSENIIGLKCIMVCNTVCRLQ